MKHLMAIMGTNLYEPVVYCESEYKSSEQEFVQMAVIEKYRKVFQEEGAQITLFATEKADELNVQDRYYTFNEEGRAEKTWKSDMKQQVKEGNLKKGFISQFKEQFPELKEKLEIVRIPDAQTEEQIWSVFRIVFQAIRENDDIIFDITHSFRSIPMLAITVINYAKILKNCTLEKICYGAYNAGNNEKSILVDLTMYDEILSWTNAANVFIRYGNASMIKENFNSKLSKIPVGQKREWSEVRKLVNNAEILSDAIQTSRGVDADSNRFVGRRDNDKADVSVKSAYRVFSNSLNNTEEGTIIEVQPLYPLMKKVQNAFSIFDCLKNYQVGMAVVEWSINNGLVQQGFTALEETIKTYMCNAYGLDEVDENDRDGLVGTAMIWLAKANLDKNQSLETPESRCDLCKKKLAAEESVRKILDRNPEKKKVFLQIFIDDNVSQSQLLYEIKDRRNDINHFGMRAQPAPSKQLKKQLEQFYERFKAIISFNNV